MVFMEASDPRTCRCRIQGGGTRYARLRGTSKPEEIEAYTISNLVGDVAQAVNALGESSAVIVGHDWGAPVAWYASLMRPDIFEPSLV